MTMNAEFVLVTPEIAKQWLKRNDRNRKMNQKSVDYLAKQLKNGEFIEHGQTISFYKDGNLADGQTRLAAVVKSGVSFKFWIVRGVGLEASMAIDSHRARSTPDILRIRTGDKWWNNNRVAMFRILWLFSKYTGRFNATKILDMVNANPDIKRKIDFAYTNSIKKRYLGSAPYLAAVSTAVDHVHMYRLERFCEVVNTGITHNKSESAAVCCREFAMTNKVHASITSRKDFFLRTQNAIHAFNEFREMKLLRPISKLIYPIFF